MRVKSTSGTNDPIENIDQYIVVLTNLIDSVILDTALDLGDDTVSVDLIKSPTGTRVSRFLWFIAIDDEIITYTEKLIHLLQDV